MLERLSAQIRDSLTAGAGLFLVLASAGVGFVWLSIAAVGSIASWAGLVGAQVLVGGAALAPFFIVLIALFFKSRARREETRPARLSNFGGGDEQLSLITQAAESLVEKSPLTALAVAAFAGALSVRYPSALTLLVQILGRPTR